MSPLEVAASIVLLEFESSYGLAFVASGRIVTSFHVVQGEKEILAHFSDGRTLPVVAVSAVDMKRDLAVLDVGLVDVTPVRPPGARLAEEGDKAFVFGMVAEEGRARWVEATIAAVQVLGGSLSVYRLEGELPPDSSGGPLVAEDGSALGVVTASESDEGIVMVAVPWKYVAPMLLHSQELGLSVLDRKPPTRDVPTHPLSMLEGANVAGLEATYASIAGAIRAGAPAYNEGDVEGCYELYADTARKLVEERDDCPGVQSALEDGLSRAEVLEDVDHQAWAMRDTFDALLQVIERFMKAHMAGKRPGKSTLLN